MMLVQCSHRLPTGVGLTQARPNEVYNSALCNYKISLFSIDGFLGCKEMETYGAFSWSLSQIKAFFSKYVSVTLMLP